MDKACLVPFCWGVHERFSPNAFVKRTRKLCVTTHVYHGIIAEAGKLAAKAC